MLMSCEDAFDKLLPEPLPAQAPVQMPAETRTGANTFGCRVNGQVWQANNTSTLAGKVLTPKITYRHGVLRLDAFRRLQVTGPVTNFSITATHVTAPGRYPLGAVLPGTGNYAKLETGNNLVEYFSEAGHSGTLTITRLDTAGAHPFVAGRFELRAMPQLSARRPADLPASLQVTEGRFDIQLSR